MKFLRHKFESYTQCSSSDIKNVIFGVLKTYHLFGKYSELRQSTWDSQYPNNYQIPKFEHSTLR